MKGLFGLGKGRLRVLKVGEIIQDLQFYPREKPNWMISFKYAEAMKSGAQFPPITVAAFDGKYVLVDGWHRMEAKKLLKEEYIEAEILSGLTPSAIYIEAVRRNTTHGQPLTTTETTRVIMRLKELKLPIEQISSILHIPIEKVEPFVVKRVVSTATGEEILKKPIYNLSSKPSSIRNPSDIDAMSGLSQLEILDNLLLLLKNKWINLKDKKVRDKLEEIQDLIRKTLK